MLRGIGPVLFGGLVLTVAACNAITGANDLGIIGEPGTLPDRDSGTLVDGSSGSSGSSGTSGTSGSSGSVADGGVVPPNAKLASCGVNLVCLPDSDGWSPIAHLFAGVGTCPSAYPTEVASQKSGGGSCNCNCSPAGGSCAGTLDVRTGAACAGAPTNVAITSGTCVASMATLLPPVAVVPHLSGVAPKSCGSSVSSALRAPTKAVTCSGATGTADAKCGTGELCFPKPSTISGALTCIIHDGEVDCPSKLSMRTVIGSAVADGRTCGTTCTCSPNNCATGGTIEAFSDQACATSVREVDVDGSCTTSGTAPSGQSYLYTASTGCGVTTPAAVIGAETYTAPRTLCCSFGF